MKTRVLVVDDDEALAEMIGIVLRNDGFEPIFCNNGAEALETFRESDPDLVLLDLMLPLHCGDVRGPVQSLRPPSARLSHPERPERKSWRRSPKLYGIPHKFVNLRLLFCWWGRLG